MIAGSRMLVSIRRFVPASRRREYAGAWAALHAAATAQGAHAWHFVSAADPGVYLEFLEFGAESDVRADPDTVAAIQALHEAFGDPYPMPKTLEEWVEVPTMTEEESG
jgi:hypothetical protein